MKPITPVNPATLASQAALDRVLRMVERGETGPNHQAGEGVIREVRPSKSAKRSPRRGKL